MFINKTLRLNNLKTRTAMNAKISVFVFCADKIIYLLLCNLHDCAFNMLLEVFIYSSKRRHLILEQWIRGKNKISWHVDNTKK